MAKANRYDNTRAWYAISTYGGHEDKVAESINQRVNNIDMKGQIFGAIVPKEKQIEIKNGKRKVVDRKIFQGYVLVEMKLSDETWYITDNLNLTREDKAQEKNSEKILRNARIDKEGNLVVKRAEWTN